MSGPSGLDMGAAWARRAKADIKVFMAGLAERLESALPGYVTVERSRDGLFSSHSHVDRIVVALDPWRYELTVKNGHAMGQRAKAVRGVVLGAQHLPVAEWLNALSADIQSLGDQDGQASTVLHDFLMS
jgi:hypothetical protein